MWQKTTSISFRTDLNVNEVIEKQSDDLYFQIDLPFPGSHEYATHFGILNDLQTVFAILENLIGLRNSDKLQNQMEPYIDNHAIVKKSLLTTAVITYCRCFGRTKGRTSNLSPTEVLSDLPDFLAQYKLLDFHHQLTKMRNEYFAHAGQSDMEKYCTQIKLRVINREEVEIKLEPTIAGVYSISGVELEKFFLVTKLFIQATEKKLKKLADKFFENLTHKSIKDAMQTKLETILTKKIYHDED